MGLELTTNKLQSRLLHATAAIHVLYFCQLSTFSSFNEFYEVPCGFASLQNKLW